MNGQLEMIPGTNRDLSLSQFFTPPELAQRVVEWAAPHYESYGHRLRVLEPSAGNGALVRPLVAAGAEVTALELDARYTKDLAALLDPEPVNGTAIVPCDFLKLDLGGTSPVWRFDLCVMNPPYEDGQDVAFILHALKFAPRVVGIFTDRILFGVERKEGLWSQVRPTRIAFQSRRPFKTRIAFQSRRPFKGAQTDYVVAELVMHSPLTAEREGLPVRAQLEWW